MKTQGSGSVDFACLAQYAAGDETLVREVLAVFHAEALEWSRLLYAEGGGWRAVVHTLKGTSRTIGAARLAVLCEAAERDGEGALGAVREELERVVAEVADYLAAKG